jgi:hypothetical protein
MYNRDAKTTKLSSRYSVKARHTPMFSDSNVHPSTVSGRPHSCRQRGRRFFSPFNCLILQDEGSVIPHLLLRILDEDAAQPNMLLAVGGSHTLGASLVDVLNPDLAGGSKYGNQLRLERALPLWGGVSGGGFAVVAIHENKRMTADEFVEVVRKGKLTDAIRKLNPIKLDGPWSALCDNESFLKKAKATKEAVAKQGVSLWRIPPRSPDLNPVGKF